MLALGDGYPTLTGVGIAAPTAAACAMAETPKINNRDNSQYLAAIDRIKPSLPGPRIWQRALCVNRFFFFF
jgi:hypothetical protein